MESRNIFISEFDRQRLMDFLDEALATANPRQRREFEVLARELKNAQVVPPDQVPGDLVTMNSRVKLRDLDNNAELVYTLVFPDKADSSAGKISVLAPIGTAMLGYRVGDTFQWEVPSGERGLTIEALLYQPEAAGDLDL